MLETLDYTIRIGSTPTFLYFDLYTAYGWCIVDPNASLKINHLGNLSVIVSGKTWNLPVIEDFLPVIFIVSVLYRLHKCNVHFFPKLNVCNDYKRTRFHSHFFVWEKVYRSWMNGKRRYLRDKLDNFSCQWSVTDTNFEACGNAGEHVLGILVKEIAFARTPPVADPPARALPIKSGN